MNWGKMNLAIPVPKYINDTLLCFTFVRPEVIDGAPDIVTCNTNGYLHEIKNKNILRCFNLHENASSVSCYYLMEKEKLVVFYLVITSGNRLLIIRRTSKYFQVVKAYNGVKEFEVFDFECLGFPQIKITFMDDSGSKICKFPVRTHVKPECNETGSTMADSLAEELQILNKHLDELSEDYNHLRKISGFSDSPSDFSGVFVGSVKFSSTPNESVQQKLLVCDKWHKVYGTYLVLGMTLHNTSNQIIDDLEVVINHEGVKDYSYGFFPASDTVDGFLFTPRKVCRSVKPDERICAVGAVHLPAFFVASEFSVPFCVTSSDLKDCFAREIFEVNVLDIASRSTEGLEERFTVEDLMAVVMARSETRVQIETEDLEEDLLESKLIKNLGFKRIKHLKDKLFYCTSTYLNEVFVGLQHVSANPAVWNMLMYTSDSSQIYFLINALYDLLPDSTAILCGDN